MGSATSTLTISQMADVTGVSVHTLRYYERVGLIATVSRTTNNHRRYAASDIEWVRFLLRLKETGMSLSVMRDYAELRAQGDSTIDQRLAILRTHHEHISDLLTTLLAHQAALEAKTIVYERLLEAPSTKGSDNASHG